MEIEAFAASHVPALEEDEARHSLILAILTGRPTDALRRWSLGGPGACAVQYPGWPIVLGELAQHECRMLADRVRDIDFPGVVGPEGTAGWFADRAGEIGIGFAEPIPQKIHAIRGNPRFPGVPGAPRPVMSSDIEVVAQWLLAFWQEATPHDQRPTRERLEKAAAGGQHMFWTVNDEPVSIAAVNRRTRQGAAIGGVYTPPQFRGRGYAGSVTAALVERIYAEGKSFACLYTDLRNPFSNRCYAKVGFTPVCTSWHYPRAERGG